VESAPRGHRLAIGVIDRIRNHPLRTAAAALALLGGLAWLAFGFFAVHTLFVDEHVSEAAPAFAAGPVSEPVAERAGTFGSGAHDTRGRALVLGDATDQRFLRFEDFETDNGPDLNVYLVSSTTGDVSDAVDLGDLKGNVGDQNYEIPAGVDLDRYDRVVVWCVRFGVAFGGADLAPVRPG
jgi:hypothetical protein